MKQREYLPVASAFECLFPLFVKSAPFARPIAVTTLAMGRAPPFVRQGCRLIGGSPRNKKGEKEPPGPSSMKVEVIRTKGDVFVSTPNDSYGTSL